MNQGFECLKNKKERLHVTSQTLFLLDSPQIPAATSAARMTSRIEKNYRDGEQDAQENVTVLY